MKTFNTFKRIAGTTEKVFVTQIVAVTKMEACNKVAALNNGFFISAVEIEAI